MRADFRILAKILEEMGYKCMRDKDFLYFMVLYFIFCLRTHTHTHTYDR